MRKNFSKRVPPFFLALALSVGLTVPALAAENVTVTRPDGGQVFTVQGVEGKENIIYGDDVLKDAGGKSPANGDNVSVLMGKPGITLDVTGCHYASVWPLGLTDGKLYTNFNDRDTLTGGEAHSEETPPAGGWDYTWDFKENDSSEYQGELNENGEPDGQAWFDYSALLPGSNLKIFKEGYYLAEVTQYKEGNAASFDPVYQVIHVTNNPVTQPTTPAAPAGTFTDVAATSPYADAVKWAVEKNITAGKTATTFAPGETCTNAQILTFLWRAKGEPAPTIANPFTDVAESNYYYKAALWASENGMVSGSALNSAAPCTRSQTVTYLWGLVGKPAAAKTVAFTDVAGDAEYAQAVAWAVEKGITTGTTATTFAPDATCTRGQIVTFLYRDMG